MKTLRLTTAIAAISLAWGCTDSRGSKRYTWQAPELKAPAGSEEKPCELRKYAIVTKNIYSLAFSPDGRLFRTMEQTSDPNENPFAHVKQAPACRIREVATGREIVQHSGWVGFSKTPGLLFTYSGARTEWRKLPSFELVVGFEGARNSRVMKMNRAKTDPKTGKITLEVKEEITLWRNFRPTVNNAEDVVVVPLSDGSYDVLRFPSGKKIGKIPGTKKPMHVYFTPDDQRILTTANYEAENSAVWDAKRLKLICRLKMDKDGHQGLRFSKDSKRLSVDGFHNQEDFYDLSTGKRYYRLENGEGRFSPDSRHFLDAGCSFKRRGKMCLRDADTLAVVRESNSYERYRLNNPYWNAAGTRIRISYWTDAENSRKKEEGPYAYTSVTETHLVYLVLNAKNLEEVYRSKKPQPNSAASLVFSPNGQRFLAWSADNTSVLRDAETGAELCRFRGHTAPIEIHRFSPDGKRALTVSADNTIRIWNIPVSMRGGRSGGRTE
jgi:WD40 repeat protein